MQFLSRRLFIRPICSSCNSNVKSSTHPDNLFHIEKLILQRGKLQANSYFHVFSFHLPKRRIFASKKSRQFFIVVVEEFLSVYAVILFTEVPRIRTQDSLFSRNKEREEVTSQVAPPFVTPDARDESKVKQIAGSFADGKNFLAGNMCQ